MWISLAVKARRGDMSRCGLETGTNTRSGSDVRVQEQTKYKNQRTNNFSGCGWCGTALMRKSMVLVTMRTGLGSLYGVSVV